MTALCASVQNRCPACHPAAMSGCTEGSSSTSTQEPYSDFNESMLSSSNGCPILGTGGFGTRKEVENKELISFLQQLGPSVDESNGSWPYLLTVCTGAALAAKAGLLNGRYLLAHCTPISAQQLCYGPIC
jgi:transcriptional regulator GlxA family with amidase domain